VTVPGRIKPKYNPTPTAREKAFHLWLMDEFPCACGCGERSTFVHHPLEEHPEQRWRRDHEYVVPMTDHCHRALHAMGKESLFTDRDFAELASQFRAAGYEEGKL
jgi:hypothetical protein